MLGYETYLEKSLNSIKTISDGVTVIQNGNINANNITGNEMDISEIRSNIISSASGIFTNVQNRFTELELDISNIGTGIEILQQDVSNNKISIQQNITDINLIETDISNNIKPDILSNQNNISLLISDVSGNKIDISNIQSDISSNILPVLSTHTSQISTLQSELDIAETNIATNSSNLSNHISNYNTFVTNTNDIILDIQGDISNNVTNINTLQADLTTAETNIDNLETNKANRSGDTFTGAVIMNSSLRVQGNLRLDNTTNIYSERNINYFQGTTTTRRLRINYNEIQFTDATQTQTFRITNTGDLEYSGLTFNKTLWDTTTGNINTSISNIQTDISNNKIDITNLQTDISSNILPQIATLQSELDTAETNIATNATNIATNTTNISTNTNSINTLQNTTLPSTYAKLVANNNFVGNNSFNGLTNLTPAQYRVNDVVSSTPILYSSNHFGWPDDARNYLCSDTRIGGRLEVSYETTINSNLIVNSGAINNFPSIRTVNGVLNGSPTYVGNLLPNLADGINYFTADTRIGGDLHVSYDVEVNGNISNNGTIFTNSISNNSTALSITSASGLTVNANTTVSGDLVVTNNTVLSNASATSSLSTPLLTLGTLPITETYFKDWTRPLILGVLYTNNTDPYLGSLNITCSVKALNTNLRNKNYFLFLERGVKLIGYNDINYVGLISTVDNTNGTTPLYYSYPFVSMESFKIYYYDVEITWFAYS